VVERGGSSFFTGVLGPVQAIIVGSFPANSLLNIYRASFYMHTARKSL